MNLDESIGGWNDSTSYKLVKILGTKSQMKKQPIHDTKNMLM